MIDQAIKKEFEALLAATPEWKPAELTDDKGFVRLPDDDPDTVADYFEIWSLATCGVRHRYNSIDGWTIYFKDKYQRVEDDSEIRGYIRLFINKHCKVKKKVKGEDGGMKTYYAKPDKKMKVTSFTNNVMDQLRTPGGNVHLLPSQKAPCSLDGKLNADQTLAMKNGLLDRSIKPYILQDHTFQYYTLNYMDYDYLPAAFSEKWGRFLIDITDNDPDMMLLLQQWAGYLLMNTTKYQKFLLCVGDGANGKGVFFDTITAAIGRNNVSNVPLAAFTESFKIFATYGKMVNMSNESAKHLEESAESVIKEYVGGDKMVWEQKHRDLFCDYPSAKLMFATNELPPIRDHSDGIWRRMIYVPFDVKFTEDQQNKDLAKQLQQPKELAGILNWMLEGIESLEQMGGFVLPKRCVDGLATYKKESNPTGLFISEYLKAGDITNFDDYIVNSEVYKRYQNWCKINGCYAKNNAHFGRAVKKAFPLSSKSRPRLDGIKVCITLGVLEQEGLETGQGDNYETRYRPGNLDFTEDDEAPF
jgi:P4 family phage/plasmid primase-like protien